MSVVRTKVKRQVIIGNGAAAINAVKAIREKGDYSSIILISATMSRAYSPVLLTYYIAGKIGRESLFIVESDFYSKYGVTPVFGKRAVAVDPVQKAVYLNDGTKIVYDGLLLATGATPEFSTKVDADCCARVLTLRTIEDAERITALSGGAKDVLILGGGLISLQIASAIFRQGINITFVVSSGQLLSQNVHTDCASMIQSNLEFQGISFLFGRRVEAIMRKGSQVSVSTDRGEELMADLVIVGKGVKPNIELVKDSVTVDTGILVDEYLKTNAESVYAAGDVCQARNLISGNQEVIANWPNACVQGRIAGLNLTGHRQRYEGAFVENITNVFGLTIAAIGFSKPTKGEFGELKYIDARQTVYRSIVLDGDRVIGAVLLNKTQDVGLIKSLIKSGSNISRWKEQIASRQLDLGRVISWQTGLPNGVAVS